MLRSAGKRAVWIGVNYRGEGLFCKENAVLCSSNKTLDQNELLISWLMDSDAPIPQGDTLSRLLWKKKESSNTRGIPAFNTVFNTFLGYEVVVSFT